MAAEEGSGGGGDGKSSPAPMKSGGGGAAKFLAGMPSRGNFSSGSVSSSLGGFRVYVCEHSTDPPEGQVIQTDSTNILIRHLQLNKQKSEVKDLGSRTPGENTRGKRSAARSLDVNNSAKRANWGTSSGSSVYGSSGETISGFSQHTLQSFTVERLRALLRQSGLSTKGKKAKETMLNLLVLKEFAEYLFKIITTSASLDFSAPSVYCIQKNFIAYHKIYWRLGFFGQL